MSVSNVAKPSTARIAFIQSSWHKEVVDQCKDSFMSTVETLGVPRDNVDLYEVPGVFEIPLQAKLLAKTGKYDAIVASGFIVNGGIYRHEFVSSAVIDGMMRVQIESEVPIISAVLTPQNFHEHESHLNFFLEHMVVKGREAAEACVKTIKNIHDAKAANNLSQDRDASLEMVARAVSPSARASGPGSHSPT